MNMIENLTRSGTEDCIIFQERIEEDNYLKIVDEIGCWSYVGKMMQKRPQTLSLQSPYCIDTENILHELVHALGFHHEHQRPDRDEYLKINFDNIDYSRRHIFKKIEQDSFIDLETPFDYKSIMLFKKNLFAINESIDTINAVKPPFKIEPGKTLSEIDIYEIRKLYNCKSGKKKTHF